MEDKIEQTISSGLSPEEIGKVANDAYAFTRNHPPEDIPPFGLVNYEPIALMLALDNIPAVLGKRFDAHGIAKGSYKQQLESLVSLLTSGINPEKPFHSMPLTGAKDAAAAFGAAGPYDTGMFIVLSKPGKMLTESITAVLVNEPFYNAVPKLQSAFPQVEFINASDAPQALGKLT